MSTKLQTLAARREALVARSQAQRAVLAAATAQLRGSLGFAERVFGVARRIHAHPLLAGAVVGVLLFARPFRALRWISNGLAAYAAFKQARQLLRR